MRVAIHCPTYKDWKKLLIYIEINHPSINWHLYNKPTKRLNLWYELKEQTCLSIEESGNHHRLGYSAIKYYEKECYEINSLKEFFEKEHRMKGVVFNIKIKFNETL
jgi:hypothetical protein